MSVITNVSNEHAYRPNVGIMIINKKGEIWLGKRADGARFKYNEQMPQGGIDKGETPETAVYRELWEETGLSKDKVTLLKQTENWYAYQFPRAIRFGNDRFIGQRQKWFLFLYEGDGSDFNLEVHPEEIEFIDYKWYAADKVINAVIPFKRDVYTHVIDEFRETIQKTVARFK